MVTLREIVPESNLVIRCEHFCLEAWLVEMLHICRYVHMFPETYFLLVEGKDTFWWVRHSHTMEMFHLGGLYRVSCHQAQPAKDRSALSTNKHNWQVADFECLPFWHHLSKLGVLVDTSHHYMFLDAWAHTTACFLMHAPPISQKWCQNWDVDIV